MVTRSVPITVPEAKADPLLRRYELRRLRLPFGCETISLIVPEPGDWIRRGEWTPEIERGAEPPYWVQVWPASVAVLWLLARRGDLSGMRVLDLGCGLGLPGIAAARAGAAVTFADQQPDALGFARWNADRHATGPTPAAVRIDWSREVVGGHFDMIVLADVSYRSVHHIALQRHLADCLAPGGLVIHSDPLRRESDPFVRLLQARFAHCSVVRPTTFGERRTSVRLVVGCSDASRLAVWEPLLRAGRNDRRGCDESVALVR